MDTSDQVTVAGSARRMRSFEEKRRIVEEASVPGASVAAVARRHGVNANLLFGWRRLHRQGLLEQCREPAMLLPVSIAPAGATARRRRKATAGAAAPATMRDASSDIEIELPGPVRLRVRGRVDSQALREGLVALGVR